MENAMPQQFSMGSLVRDYSEIEYAISPRAWPPLPPLRKPYDLAMVPDGRRAISNTASHGAGQAQQR